MSLATSVDRLVDQVAHWTAPRWARSGAAPAMHELIQHVADLAADAEGEPRRPVPRLDNDLALPDQLRVVTADLLAARPSKQVLAEAESIVEHAARSILMAGSTRARGPGPVGTTG